MEAQELICPACSRVHAPDERFCASCGMPLVHSEKGSPRTSERQRRARKIKPQYTEGQLVKVARGANRSEAEFIGNLLLEEGVPSMLRSSFGAPIGAYAPEVGAYDVLVPASGAEAAREALAYQQPAP
ncbi:MAG TPA: DUF2007 domain-containing protein [Solirubrobacteraceae bacterium]|nr:DUF2007 domain-containing protein [Solirubrobacteraceae bacterium]